MSKSLIIKGANFSYKPLVPAYTLLNYLTSASTSQTVDTGVLRTLKMKMEVIFSIPPSVLASPTTGFHFLAGYAMSSASAFQVAWHSNGRIYGRTVANQSMQSASVTVSDSEKHTVTLSPTALYLDGNVIMEADNTANTTFEDIYIMGSKGTLSNTNIVGTDLYIHEVKLYSDYEDDNSLVHDFIPVKKKDGTICFLDKTTSEYKVTNDGENPIYG